MTCDVFWRTRRLFCPLLLSHLVLSSDPSGPAAELSWLPCLCAALLGMVWTFILRACLHYQSILGGVSSCLVALTLSCLLHESRQPPSDTGSLLLWCALPSKPRCSRGFSSLGRASSASGCAALVCHSSCACAVRLLDVDWISIPRALPHSRSTRGGGCLVLEETGSPSLTPDGHEDGQLSWRKQKRALSWKKEDFFITMLYQCINLCCCIHQNICICSSEINLSDVCSFANNKINTIFEEPVGCLKLASLLPRIDLVLHSLECWFNICICCNICLSIDSFSLPVSVIKPKKKFFSPKISVVCKA